MMRKKKAKSERTGSTEEQYVLDQLSTIIDIEPTKNSGATNSDKDLKSKDFLVEIKSTKFKTYKLDPKLVDSVDLKAFTLDKDGGFLVVVIDSSKEIKQENVLYIFPQHLALTLLERNKCHQQQQ